MNLRGYTMKGRILEVLNQNDGVCLDSEEDKNILFQLLATAATQMSVDAVRNNEQTNPTKRRLAARCRRMASRCARCDHTARAVLQRWY